MKRTTSAVVALAVAAVLAVPALILRGSGAGHGVMVAGMQFSWQQPAVDGHMTGVTVPGVDGFDKSIGVVEDSVYTSAGGAVFVGGSTAAAARIMLDHQERMAPIREVIGYSENGLVKGFPESPLSNWAADLLLSQTALLTGEKVDVAVVNFGGIRVDFPVGNIILDDVRSMFPFRNYICLVKLSGESLTKILEELATKKLEAVGGCTLKAREGKLVEALVGGEPVDPKKEYGLATIDFLLDGGDGHKFGSEAVSITNTGVLIGTVVEQFVRDSYEQGRTIDYQTDGRIDIVWPEKKK